MLRVFIGWDDRETIAYHVCAHSIISRASGPVSIIPLKQDSLRLQNIYRRPDDVQGSTAFTLTRFLVPYLSGYDGISIFMDCDMLVQADIYELLKYPNEQPDKSVFVVKHDYTPKTGPKFLGRQQHVYPRKNWSSVMVFRNSYCGHLGPGAVNTQTPAYLHRLQWLPDSMIGELPREWNWLVGEYELNDLAKNLHFTRGGPWFEEFQDCDHADLWRNELNAMVRTAVAA